VVYITLPCRELWEKSNLGIIQKDSSNTISHYRGVGDYVHGTDKLADRIIAYHICRITYFHSIPKLYERMLHVTPRTSSGNSNNQPYSVARFEVFMAVKIQVEVVWVVTPCSVMVGYRRFGGPWCLHPPEDRGSMDLWISGILTLYSAIKSLITFTWKQTYKWIHRNNGNWHKF